MGGERSGGEWEGESESGGEWESESGGEWERVGE